MVKRSLGTECLGLGLFVNWNPQLLDLDGLKALASITGDLMIWNNDSLEYVRGLSGLQDVRLAMLDIRGNDELLHLDGLEGLVGADRLFITYNTRMSTSFLFCSSRCASSRVKTLASSAALS